MVCVYGASVDAPRGNSNGSREILEVTVESLRKEIKALERLVDSQEQNLIKKERVIVNQRETLTRFFTRLSSPKRKT